MDSMRSLNTSLPKSSSKRAKPTYPQAGLQQAFKAAAFSVTQLYKAAAAEEDTAHAAGYQAAIDELLGFLDAENLGLGDGEGWRVRQWATERLTPNIYGSDSEEEEEGAAEPKHPESTSEEADISPTDHVNTSVDKGTTAQQQVSTGTATSPPTRNAPTTVPDDRPRHSSMFQFTANPTSNDIDMSASSPTNTNTMTPPTSLRLNVRPSRQPKRRRSREPSQPRAQSLGLGAGLKRKSSTNFDFTDFAGFEKDWHGHGGGSGGGGGSAKRGRWE